MTTPKCCMLIAIALVVAALSLAQASAAVGAEYFVTPKGSDEGDGGPRAPWKTISRGLTALQPGDTLTIGPGTYREACRVTVKGTREAPVVVRCAPGCVLEAPDGNGFVIDRATHLTVAGLAIRGAKEAAFVLAGCDYVTIEGCLIADSAACGVRISGSDHVTVSKCDISGTVDGDAVHAATSEHVSVTDCKISDNARSAVRLSAKAGAGDGLMTGCTVARNIMKANGAKGGAVILLEGVEKSFVENNVCDRNFDGAVACVKGEASKAGSRNRISGTVIKPEPGRSTYGIKLADGSTNAHLEQNTIDMDTGLSLVVDEASSKGFRSSFNFFAGKAEPRFSWKGTQMSLSQWQAATGQDTDSHASGPGNAPVGQQPAPSQDATGAK